MKKSILFFLFLATTMVCYPQYTAVPDPNFEDFLEANGMGDGVPGNGQVLTANIENVITLDLDSQIGVTDLTGIEDFIALEWLDISYNLVEQVDLSQNSMLKTLGCTFNPLTSLDLSSNTHLEWLSCQGSQLTSLLLNSQMLVVVECFENYLTSLDLSNVPSLIEIDCSQNQISALDLSQNLFLEVLSCSSNNIASLDTSNNPELFYLVCGRNDIESLDLTQNPALTLLLAPFMPPLNHLDLRNGNNENIGSFNVYGTDNLQCIFVDDASATYLDDWYKDPFTTFVNNEAECDALGNQEFVMAPFKIFPNPAKTYFNISSKVEGEYSLISVQGKIVRSGTLNVGLSRIPVEGFLSGLYFLRVSTVNGTTTEKIVVQ
ncbi:MULTISPECIES: T9SS type A sorting domain-containing protein [Aequorivita]|uniref:T9SS type A sorting domain-containing protein n=2 Tax=Aequorivita TaxID=153265 RepID=A0AB35YN12_9FLAO|nr:T9SS type A sorting domain-containing protein [Aequorivita sp. Ant34-E75]WGF91874.1 T9SS type A sorting domain-containing protein [Aequorivita sp. Ant34-E75]